MDLVEVLVRQVGERAYFLETSGRDISLREAGSDAEGVFKLNLWSTWKTNFIN